jgi:hypothetical protein
MKELLLLPPPTPVFMTLLLSFEGKGELMPEPKGAVGLALALL